MPHQPAIGLLQRLRAMVAGAAAPAWLQALHDLRHTLVDRALRELAADLPADDPCHALAHATWDHLIAFFSGCFAAGRLRPQVTATVAHPLPPTLLWPEADHVVIGPPEDAWSLHRHLGRHLEDRLDRYLHDGLLDLDGLLDADPTAQRAALALAQSIRQTARRLIRALAWWDEAVLALWEATRPIRHTAWVVTLDRVPASLYPAIAGNEAIRSEWQRLFPGLLPADRPLTADTLHDWRDTGLSIDSRHLSAAEQATLLRAVAPGGDCGDGLVIIGDNADGLRLLSGSHEGRIDSLYIDPPYNTGGGGFLYHDGYDHATWLTMMRDRLALAAPLLRADSAVLISCDDHEQHRLRALLEAVDLPSPFLANLIWKSRQNVDSRNRSNLSNDHEFILTCGQRFRGAEKDLRKYANPDDDPRGPWMSDNMVGLASRARRPNLHYHLLVAIPEPDGAEGGRCLRLDERTFELPESCRHPGADRGDRVLACLSWDRASVLAWTWLSAAGANGRALPGLYPCPDKGWRYEPAAMLRKAGERRIIWPARPGGRPRKKTYRRELRSAYTGFSTVVGHTADGTRELSALFGPGAGFNFPKPVSLLTTLLAQTLPVDGLALDYFAGTGTTAHAVIALNRADGGRRRYVMIESAAHAEAVLLPRIRKALVAEDWQDGRPRQPRGISHVLQALWLASFADHLAGLPWPDVTARLAGGAWPEPRELVRQLVAGAEHQRGDGATTGDGRGVSRAAGGTGPGSVPSSA